MKKFIFNIRGCIKKHKKISCAIIIVILSVLLGGAYLINMNKEVLSMKEEVFGIEVKSDISKDASTYFDGIKDVAMAQLDFANVDNNTLGEYEGKLNYKDNEYIIKFKIVDTTAPVIATDNHSFSYPLNSSIEEVNDGINAEIKITDNFDEKFNSLEIITEIPNTEEEISKTLSIKDTSGNLSNEVLITIHFTQEEVAEEVIPQQPQTKPDTTPNTTPKTPSFPKEEPKPEPKPIPEPTPQPTPQPKPEPEPEVPSYTTPAGAFDVGLFNSKEEARAGVSKYNLDPNSEYCGWLGQINKLSNGQWHAYLFRG